MRTGTGKLLALAVAGLLVLPRIVAALDLYTHDFNADPVGTVTRPNDTYLYQFHGDTGVTLVEEVTAADGVGGTPSYRQTITATGAPYFYSGFGQFAVDATNMPTGPDASNPAMYRFSADVKAVGNLNTTAVQFRVAGIDADYETEHNIDVDNNGTISGGAAVFTPVFSPTISASNQYVHFSFTLDQATQDVDPDVRPQDRVFSNGLSLLWQASFNNGGFDLDAGNMVSVDNVKLEFLGQVPAGLAGDYNSNHIVDAADYTVWRDRLGGTTLTNESASPGMVDSADYDYWKAHFGATSPGTGLASASGCRSRRAGC